MPPAGSGHVRALWGPVLGWGLVLWGWGQVPGGSLGQPEAFCAGLGMWENWGGVAPIYLGGCWWARAGRTLCQHC